MLIRRVNKTMQKAILIIVDGVGYDTMLSQCGYLEASVEAGMAHRWKMQACLPSLSGPLYETLHTGLTPLEHGILSNEAMRASSVPNIFQLLHGQGRVTAAVAHSFFFELYCGRTYKMLEDIEIDDESMAIQHGRYYSMEAYSRANPVQPADIDLCAQANNLVRKFTPDYMLIHMCAGDTLGHLYTSDSAEYRKQAWHTDNALARIMPEWLQQGYQVFVTSDHGMNTDGHHGGNEDLTRDVAFYYFGQQKNLPAADEVLDQCRAAPSILQATGMDPSVFPLPGIFS